MAGPFINDIACVCENGGSFRTYGQYGSYGSLCTSCGAQGPVTSLMSILPRDHSKAKISVDQSPGDEVVGPVAAYQEWIMERAGAGHRVWIDSCACDRCGGSISVEVVDQLVTERCRSCQQEVQYVSTVPLPYRVHKEPRHYRIPDPPPAPAIDSHPASAPELRVPLPGGRGGG